MKPSSQRPTAAAILTLILAVCSSGCIPVRTTNLEGSGRVAIRSYDDKAELYARFGAADAETTDGRFSLYSLRKEAEWWLIGPQDAGPISDNEVGRTHVLIEFDAANLAIGTHFHNCRDDTRELVCFESAEEILFALIGEKLGPGEEARQRMREIESEIRKLQNQGR